MPKEVNPKDTKRAAAYELWMKAPNPMVTFFKTLDVTNLLRISKKRKMKFNMLLDYCIGKAAAGVKEFYLLPVKDKLIQYDRIAVNTIVKNREGEVVIEAVPGHCAVCGAEIRRYGKNGEVIQTCDHCHSLLPEVKEELAQSKADQLLMKIEERMGIVQENVKLCQTLINKIKTLKLD